MSMSRLRFWIAIEEKNPLKQGLKPEHGLAPEHIVAYWREESIKTRIETGMDDGVSRRMDNWREESIKTRIETIILKRYCAPIEIIEEKNPLKQGLKLKTFS